MKAVFSNHAPDQMKLRRISVDTANEILNHPGSVIAENGITIYQSVIIEDGKSYLIRIFVNDQKNPNLVITAYKTSKISKYYEGKI